MLWFAAKTCDPKIVGLSACACARTALKYVTAGEDRPRICIETTEAYWNGKASVEEVRKARDNAANAAAAAAAANAAAAAAADAADAADAYDAACNSSAIVRTFIHEVPL